MACSRSLLAIVVAGRLRRRLRAQPTGGDVGELHGDPPGARDGDVRARLAVLRPPHLGGRTGAGRGLGRAAVRGPHRRSTSSRPDRSWTRRTASTAVRFPNLADFGDDATWYRHSTTRGHRSPRRRCRRCSPARTRSPRRRSGPTTRTTSSRSSRRRTSSRCWSRPPSSARTTSASPPRRSTRPLATTSPSEIDVGPGFGDLLGVTSDLWLERVSLGRRRAGRLRRLRRGGRRDAPRPRPRGGGGQTSPSVTVPPGPARRRPGRRRSRQNGPTALIESFDEAKGPALYYLHLILPHQPFNRYPDGTKYEVVDPFGIGPAGGGQQGTCSRGAPGRAR